MLPDGAQLRDSDDPYIAELLKSLEESETRRKVRVLRKIASPCFLRQKCAGLR
jgi:hypothetical protein